MKIYDVIIPPDAEDDIRRHRISGNKAALKKLDDLITELEEHPRIGTGKPSQKI
jgi:toxin YoeB